MALTTNERQTIERAKEKGLSPEQAYLSILSGRKPEQPQQEFGRVGRMLVDAPSDVLEFGQSIEGGFGELKQGLGDIQQRMRGGKTGFRSGTLQGFGEAAKFFSNTLGSAVVGVGKLFTTPETEKAISKKVEEVGGKIVETKPFQTGVEIFSALEPETQRNITSIFRLGEAALDTVGLGLVGQFAKNLRRSAQTAIDTDDFIKQADDAIKMSPDISPQQVSLVEKWAGVSPDIKQRISGKHEQMGEYFQVAHARNGDIPTVNKAGELVQADTLPTAFGYAKTKVNDAVEEMETLLNQTGGEIGATRQKLGSVTMNIDGITKIESTFIEQLKKINLEIRGGQIRQIPGTITKVASNNDINVLNDLYANLLTFKQSPNLTNAIDLRSFFDAKINFGKSSQEVSNSVDPLSRRMRRSIADEAATIVGKSEAEKLAEYSNFMDAYNDLRGFTDRRAGGEYLLRLVLSGRGEEARVLIDTIKKYTGKDLMDDAVMATIATDLVGNINQKNLFRQEITKAGLDAAKVLSGDPKAGAAAMFQFVVNKFMDEERIFMEAAGAPRKFNIPGGSKIEDVSGIPQSFKPIIEKMGPVERETFEKFVDSVRGTKKTPLDLELRARELAEGVGINVEMPNSRLADELTKIMDVDRRIPRTVNVEN